MSKMETEEESFIDVKVEVKEEDVASMCGDDDSLLFNHQTSVWRDDSEARNCLSEGGTVSRYVESLQEEKKQYFSKLRLKDISCALPDPYKIVGWVNNMKEWPDLHSGHIHQYLLCNQNPLTPGKTSASLDGYECFRSGNVLAVVYNPVNSAYQFCFLKAKVVPSYSITAEPYEPWVCLDKTESSIQSSHCTCMTGLEEVCSHIAALLFKIEAVVSLEMNKEYYSSSKFAVWNRCYRSKNHVACVKDIDFSHPNKTKKYKRPFKQLRPQPLSVSEQKAALIELKKILPNCVLFQESSDTDTASESEEELKLPAHLDQSSNSSSYVKVENGEVPVKVEENETWDI